MMTDTHTIEIGKDLISIKNESSDECIKCVEFSSNATAQPFIKWAGGKKWLSKAVDQLKPQNWSGKYYEPFLGGGSFFFSLAPKSAKLSDINSELITTYKVIRYSHKKLIKKLNKYPYDKDFYYAIRESDPQTKLEVAARFIYLNKSCWNGLYRVNSKGKFNTPFGKHSNPTICDEDRLNEVSRALKNIDIQEENFEKALSDVKTKDWIYLDPPYITGHQNNGFLEYNKNLFSWEDQKKLAETALEMADKGANVLVSNADYPKVVELYKGFYFYRTMRRSLIGGSINSRGFVSEAIISSYPILETQSKIIT